MSCITTDSNNPKLKYGIDDVPTDQNEVYLVLSEEERSKGFIRPLRYEYFHETCRTKTIMSRAIAETYARDPKFYGATYCCFCKKHRPVAEFLWVDRSGITTNIVVGS